MIENEGQANLMKVSIDGVEDKDDMFAKSTSTIMEAFKNRGSVAFSFIEKSINTIMGLHDSILSSKNETLNSLKSENEFLKETVIGMQEILDRDSKVIYELTSQLENGREEINRLKKKQKYFWNNNSHKSDTMKSES